MEEEIWVKVPGSEKYEVSDRGNIRSLDFRRTGQVRLMKPGKDRNGYLYICLMENGKGRWHKVHRLVYEAFKGPIPEGFEINHLNEIKDDNRIENLEAVSHKDNINYGTCSGRAGEKHRKGVCQYDLDGNIIKDDWASMSEAGKTLGIDVGQISACCQGKPHYNTAGDYIWRQKERE